LWPKIPGDPAKVGVEQAVRIQPSGGPRFRALMTPANRTRTSGLPESCRGHPFQHPPDPPDVHPNWGAGRLSPLLRLHASIEKRPALGGGTGRACRSLSGVKLEGTSMQKALDLLARARMFDERAARAADPISAAHYREMAAHYRALAVEHQSVQPTETEHA
jgi:hypothetical protein